MKQKITYLLSLLTAAAFVGILAARPMTNSRMQHKIAKVHLKGMTCQSCAKAIEKGLGKLPEVKSCKVSLEKGVGIVVPKKGKTLSAARIKKAVEKAGYKVAKIEWK